ncbi:unnamed protein product [Adineta ricciae]|uniref:Uncharacterized protein n=1 Tax=Adineta ricciae TaxID=249248 RepID=A0A814IWY7_ADIRI|nr:unnamed protein product [Adineta ricciae]
MLLLSANSEELVNIDNTICGGPPSVIICVQRTLNEIATAANNIHSLTIRIEQNIHQRDPNTLTLQNHIINKLSNINNSLPSSKTHQQFMIMNNIDKSDLIHLMKEQDYAVSFLYKSVDNIRHLQSMSENDEVDDPFDRIQSEQRTDDDHMCRINDNILCVKDEFKEITSKAAYIIQKTLEIEKILNQTKLTDKVFQRIIIERNYTLSSLPPSHYLDDLIRKNNINRKFLVELLAETHNALIYFANNIIGVRLLENNYGQDVDHAFANIQTVLKFEMVCRYRNVMNVFSVPWKSIHEINDRLHFSARMKHLCLSDYYAVRSIVIARHLHEWMQNLTKGINDLETKYLT